MALWQKEWLEFSRRGRALPLRLGLPLLIAGPLMRWEAVRLPVLAGLLVWLGLYLTAAQVARERVSGLLPRLALAPVRPEALVLQKVAARTLQVGLQVGGVVALACWLGTPRGILWLLLPAVPACSAAGTLVGLRAPSRRVAQVTGLMATFGAAAVAWGMELQPRSPWLPGPQAAGAGFVAAGMTVTALPVRLALWLLAAAALAGALREAPKVLGAPEE